MMNNTFDRSRLSISALSERKHDLDLSIIKPLAPFAPGFSGLPEVAADMVGAIKRKSSLILMMGAHVIRAGVQRFLIDLMKQGYVSCLAMNGAGMIHDYEFALCGATTESVSRYIKDGHFGLWRETGVLNDVINRA